MTFPESEKAIPTANYDLPTAALEFEEFSFWGPDGSMHPSNVSKEHHNAMRAYLNIHYHVVDFIYCEPFLILGCEKELPREDERPFSIAGLIAIWREANDMQFNPHIGHLGAAEPIGIDTAMVELIHALEPPPHEVLLYLADHVFPDCQALSILWETLIVELPKTSEEEFLKRLQILPEGIDHAPIDLRFHNGPLPNTERRRRAVTPKPEVLDELEADETDYVKADGRFYPGSMISSVNKGGKVYSSATAGVLIEKGNERRLTGSFHLWADHYEKYPNNFGQADPESRRIFQVMQGDPGTAIGFAKERMGKTDIALIQLADDIVFENKFMEMEYSAKTFIHSEDQSFRDAYLLTLLRLGNKGCRDLGDDFK